jgi:hypothetical protein
MEASMGARVRIACGIAGVGLLAGLLTGCGSVNLDPAPSGLGTPTPTPIDTTKPNLDADYGEPYTFYVTLPNKAQVFCIGINGPYGLTAPPSIDCDYANAQGLNKLPPSQR